MCSKLSILQAVFFILLVHHTEGIPPKQVKKGLCGLKTDEVIRHYGYNAEKHNVITEDGYILTIYRCNSFKFASSEKKPVVLQHGILLSSDDFCLNTPNRSLVYMLADAGYDIWIPNSRGNFYSRKHISKNPDAPSSGFWDFSWYEMGIYDQPAVIDYVLKQTDSYTKVFYVGFSQGTTSVMVLLSEKPEYNKKIHIVSMMSPVGFMSHSDSILRLSTRITALLNPIFPEFFPRGGLISATIDTVCTVNVTACNDVVDLLFGPSDHQRTRKSILSFLCHAPSGSSFKQFNHYVQETKFGFFGKYMTGPNIPRNFDLSKITTPISFHYSTSDRVSNATDVEFLKTKLKSVFYVQRIETPKLNHVDLVWHSSATIIYSKFLSIFEMYQ